MEERGEGSFAEPFGLVAAVPQRGSWKHLERIAVALERIAEAVAPQARPKERAHKHEEHIEVNDTDRAFARRKARGLGLVVRTNVRGGAR